MKRIKIFYLLIFLTLSACMTSTKQVDALENVSLGIPETKVIEDVPFVQQSAGHCGPATLSMALAWAGKPNKLSEVTPQVYTPGSVGSFQMDMITAARRQGMMAIPISGIRNLLLEIAQGHPVIVFENLALSWAPRWHYAIVFGYDLPKQEVLMHSGPEKDKRWTLKKLERSWQLADHWGLVVLPPGKISATATELEHARAAAAIERQGHIKAADKAYKSILDKWPRSLPALIGRGNIAFHEQRVFNSEEFLAEAVRIHPLSAEAWHNLSVVQRRLGKYDQSSSSQIKANELRKDKKSL